MNSYIDYAHFKYFRNYTKTTTSQYKLKINFKDSQKNFVLTEVNINF